LEGRAGHEDEDSEEEENDVEMVEEEEVEEKGDEEGDEEGNEDLEEDEEKVERAKVEKESRCEGEAERVCHDNQETVAISQMETKCMQEVKEFDDPCEQSCLNGAEVSADGTSDEIAKLRGHYQMQQITCSSQSSSSSHCSSANRSKPTVEKDQEMKQGKTEQRAADSRFPDSATNYRMLLRMRRIKRIWHIRKLRKVWRLWRYLLQTSHLEVTCMNHEKNIRRPRAAQCHQVSRTLEALQLCSMCGTSIPAVVSASRRQTPALVEAGRLHGDEAEHDHGRSCSTEQSGGLGRRAYRDEVNLWDLSGKRNRGAAEVAQVKECLTQSMQGSVDILGNNGCGDTGWHGPDVGLHRSRSDSSITLHRASRWAWVKREMNTRKQADRQELQDGNFVVDSQTMRQAVGIPHGQVTSAMVHACSPDETAISEPAIGEQTKRPAIVPMAPTAPMAPVRPSLPPRSASWHARRGFALAAQIKSAQRVTPAKHGTVQNQNLAASAAAVSSDAASAALATLDAPAVAATTAAPSDAPMHPSADVTPICTTAQKQQSSPHELLVVPAFRRVMPACPI